MHPLLSKLESSFVTYFHRIINWDPTLRYDQAFQNIDWLVELVAQKVPSALFEKFSFRVVQFFASHSLVFAFELLGKAIAKYEYSLITTFVIQPYFSQFI